MEIPHIEVNSIAGLILDINDDVHGDILRVVGHLMPDEVKNYTIDSIEKLASLRDDDFGAIFHVSNSGETIRKYALHDPESTWLSSAYYYANLRKIPQEARAKIAGRIKEACVRFGVEMPESLLKIAKFQVLGVTPSGMKKMASINSIPSHHVGLPKELSWPLFEPKDVENAVQLFEEKIATISPIQRTVLARSIAYRAGELGLNIGDHTLVSKYATSRLSPFFGSFLSQRDEATSYSAKEDIAKITKVAGFYYKYKKDELPIAERCLFLDKLAGLVEAFDRDHDLQFLWGSRLPDPMFSVFSPSQISTSEEEVPITKVADNLTVDQHTIKNMDFSRLEGKFEKHVIDSLKSDPWSVFNSLPKPHQALILQEVRKHPAAKGKSVKDGGDDLHNEQALVPIPSVREQKSNGKSRIPIPRYVEQPLPSPTVKASV